MAHHSRKRSSAEMHWERATTYHFHSWLLLKHLLQLSAQLRVQEELTRYLKCKIIQFLISLLLMQQLTTCLFWCTSIIEEKTLQAKYLRILAVRLLWLSQDFLNYSRKTKGHLYTLLHTRIKNYLQKLVTCSFSKYLLIFSIILLQYWKLSLCTRRVNELVSNHFSFQLLYFLSCSLILGSFIFRQKSLSKLLLKVNES